jgi:uncharacterized membrane protein YeaQ/YmgE (transglycosylase-associated protein family)
MASLVVNVLVIGFVTGALARLAVPGPDPMPLWLTTGIGLVGSVVGGGIAILIFGRNATAYSVGAFVAAVLLVVAYRRFVQKRPLSGPAALRFPERGFGVRRQRERLERLGVPLDPAAALAARTVSPQVDADTNDLLVKLNDLHRAGVLTDEEYMAKRGLVHERDDA